MNKLLLNQSYVLKSKTTLSLNLLLYVFLMLISTQGVLAQARPSIAVTNVTTSPVCVGSTVIVTFTAFSGNGSSRYDGNSTYTAYLSSSTGGTPYINIGTFTNTTFSYGGNGSNNVGITGTVTIPIATAAGTGYKIAIGSSAPTFDASTGAGTYAGTITISVATVGGSIAGSSTVCTGTNSTSLTLSGQTGSITKWQSSTVSDFSSGVSDIVNTTTSLTATNIITTTYYRAVITSGSCPSANSSTATITVNPTSVGGSISGGTTVCSGANSTSLTLSGQTGSITKWQSSTVSNFSSGVVDIANTTTSLSATNLTSTTYYRAVVTSGVCSAANSNTATITVSPTSVGGSISGGTTICSGINNTSLTLSGQTGSVTKWQSSTVSDFSSGVVDIANTTTSLSATNLTSTTYYRAVVTSGVCSATNSSTATITVSPTSVGGSISGGTTVCSGTNNTSLTLSGQTGSVTKWQSSTVSNFSSGVVDIANTTTSLSASNLTATAYYRAVVTSGVCSATNSSTATITVSPTSVGGSVSGGTTVCSGTNSTSLTLSGQTGSITKWQSSTTSNFSSGVVDIVNTTTSLTAANLSITTYYRAVVTSGVCSATNSSSATINVDAPSVGGVLSANAAVCAGTNSTILTLSGYTGSINKWQSSTTSDFSSGVTNIANASNSLTVTDLTVTTYYLAFVTNGSCPSAQSNVVTITVSPNITYYYDNDGDGFGLAPVVSCSGPPANTVSNNLDTDDNLLTYVDNDGDGFGSTILAPSGVTNSLDSNDNLLTYIDADSDSYGSTVLAPNGVTNSSDCDDNDNTKHDSFLFYIDADGDSFGSENFSVECAVNVETAPSGFSTNSNDCNDTDNTKHSSYQFYVDADGDGFGSETTSIQCAVDAETAPTGFSVNNTDCNDNNVNVNPNAIEICDGIDNNCNGQIDEGCNDVNIVADVFSSVCANTANGYINLNITGGLAPYSFSWSNGATSQDIYGLAPGNYTLTITDSNFIPISQTFSIGLLIPTIKPNAPSSISGSIAICPDTTIYTYRVQGIPNAGSYNWTVPANCTIISGQGTRIITVQFSANYATSYLKVTASNCIGTSTPTLLEVKKMAKPAKPDSISGTYKVCVGDTRTYSITPVPNADYYNWIAPPNSTIVSPQGRTSVTITFNAGYTTDYLRVTANNCSGYNGVTAVTIYRRTTPQTPTTLSGPASVCLQTYTYSTPANANAMSFLWTVPNNATIDSGQGSNSISVTYNAGFSSGNISVSAINCNGTSGTRSKFINLNCSTPKMAEVVTIIENEFKAIAYPNPFNESFNIDLKTSNEEKVVVTVYDMMGRLIDKQLVNPSDMSGLQIGYNYKSGVYNIIVSQGNIVKTLRIIKR